MRRKTDGSWDKSKLPSRHTTERPSSRATRGLYVGPVHLGAVTHPGAAAEAHVHTHI